jgi:mannosyltransferase OCH1-like enzyme
MIPKKFHVVWLGGEMPEKEKQFLEKNLKMLNDYEFYFWNNDTYKRLLEKSSLNVFVEWCIENKRYAFASDVLKLLSIYEYGGWALDSDNEILQSLDKFSEFSWVSGFERFSGKTHPITAIWGAIPGHNFTKILLDYYENKNFKKLSSVPNTRWISKILIDHGIENNNKEQYCKSLDVKLYPDYIFCGPEKLNETYALHHFKGSWL